MSTPSNNYSGNNTDGQFDPTYAPAGEDSTPINVVHMPMLVGGKQIAGYQATYANGTSKWTAHVHTDSLWDNDRFDNSTFTGSYNESTEKWTWKPTTRTSIQNLANDWKGNGVDYETVTKSQITTAFNNKTGAETNQKRFSGVQTNALVAQEGSLTALKENEKFSKLPGVNATATTNNTTTENGSDDYEFTEDSFNTTRLRNLTGSIEATQVRKTYGNYYYPQDITSNKQDRIIFTMQQSSGSEINIDLNDPTVRNFQRKISPINGSVTLPITTGIKDLNSVDWQGSTMNPMQAFGAASAINIIEEKGRRVEAVGDALNEAGDFLTKNKGVAKALNAIIAGEAVGTQNLLSRATGAIANPNMELLFNAPGLRAFEFSFQMSPRDPREAQQIKSIINFFKQGMSVKTTSSNVFLKAPNIFNIDYVTFNDQGKMMKHPSINVIKTCALLSCSVDYTPNNSYMTYSDSTRSMVAYTMNLQFNELDPVYESDYYTGLDMQNSDAPSTLVGF